MTRHNFFTKIHPRRQQQLKVLIHQQTQNPSITLLLNSVARDSRVDNCSYYYNDHFRKHRWFSSSPPPSSLSSSSSTITTTSSNTNEKVKTGQEQYSLFQQQMLELNREQKHFSGQQQNNDDDDNGGDDDSSKATLSSSSSSSSSSSYNDSKEQFNDWRNEQIRVFGEELQDHDINSNNNEDYEKIDDDITNCMTNDNIDKNELDNVDDFENKMIERDAMFEFSSHDRHAWGKPPPNQDSMRQILNEIQIERDRHDKEEFEQQQQHQSRQSSSLSPPLSSSQLKHHESFSHVSEDGTGVHMVDVGKKSITPRMAHARSEVWLPYNVLEAFLPSSTSTVSASGEEELELIGPKGPIFTTAKIAGIMAAKKTSDLIPLCHPLPLDQVQLNIQLQQPRVADNSNNDNNNLDKSGGIVIIDCICRVTHKTGVEMEALTGATVAALTIYDMTKAVSHNIRITETRLIAKTGGKRTVLDSKEE